MPGMVSLNFEAFPTIFRRPPLEFTGFRDEYLHTALIGLGYCMLLAQISTRLGACFF